MVVRREKHPEKSESVWMIPLDQKVAHYYGESWWAYLSQVNSNSTQHQEERVMDQ